MTDLEAYMNTGVMTALSTDNVWFTSDQHHMHKNIISYCERPFRDVEHMTVELLANHNATVHGETAAVINLGDFSLSTGALWIVPFLNGTQFLIPGNHDKVWSGHRKYLSYFPAYVTAGFHLLSEQETIWIDGVEFLMSHLPYAGESRNGIEDRYRGMRPIDNGLPLICGHVHEQWKTNGRQFNVGVDVNDFKPVHISEIAQWEKDSRA